MKEKCQADTGGFQFVQDHSGLQSEFHGNQSNTKKPYHKNK